MQAHQQRVVEERAELVERLSNLYAFIESEKFLSLPFEERTRLVSQSEYMQRYSEVLGQRIEWFERLHLPNMAQEVVWAIERCGASPEITDAVTIASSLTSALRKHLES